MKFIEFRGFKDIFIGLTKDEKSYYLVYGKIGTAEMDYSEENIDITDGRKNILLNFCKNKQLNINIPFIPMQHGALTNIQMISDKNEYYTILSVLENLL